MEYSEYLNKAKSKKKQNKKLLDNLHKLSGKKTDEMFHRAHDEAFKIVDCLYCANCCKTTGPLFTNKDIERISSFLNLKPGEFIEQFLRIDEDQDYVLQKTPCSFLREDNYCSIYEVRPKACREYPHTDMKDMKSKLKITYLNSTICPAVAVILDRIEFRLMKD